jgi:hypothetical protein
MKTSTSLEVLLLNGCNMRNDHAHLIASALKMNCTLRVLQMNGNHILKTGWESIVNILKDNSSLQSIQAKQNEYIPPDVVSSIITALSQNSSIIQLELTLEAHNIERKQVNEWQNEIARYLSSNRRSLQALTKLSLCQVFSTRINQPVAEMIISMLGSNSFPQPFGHFLNPFLESHY